MTVNEKFISRLIGILEGASELGTANVRSSATRTVTTSRSRYTSLTRTAAT